MASYCCACLGIFYCCYGSFIVGGICKEEYKERILRCKRIKEEYNKVRDINNDVEFSNIVFSNLESKLSTIDEEIEEKDSTLLY